MTITGTCIERPAVYGYDAANRMVEVMEGAGNSFYGYDPDNRRIYYRDVNNNETIYFYGADGKKLATYTYTIIQYITQGNPEIQLTQQSMNVYFLGKLISAEGNPVTTDRLGSVQHGGPGGLGHQSQYPYGVEYTLTANDREKYATYTRDSLTGLDYAVNRYYSSQWGRFLSPDPYGKSISPKNPQSWNRYAYVGGDPVNSADPSGLYLLVWWGNWPWGLSWGWDGGLCADVAGPGTDPCGSGSGGSGGGGGVGGGLYAMDARALTTYARQFAKALLSENIPTDCAGDIANLGITPEEWAGALDSVSVLNGIGSQVSLASTLPNGSVQQQVAQSSGITVGQTFSAGSSGSLQVAMASVNGPQVWINPFLVNPGDTQADSALIAHETLHNLGLTDTTVQQDLGIPVTNNTVNISNKLQQDCFPGPPGNIMP